jgi:signal transduction histidine kinase
MSIAFAGVVIIVAVVVGAVAGLGAQVNPDNVEVPAEVQAYLEEQRRENFPFGGLAIAVIVGGVAIVAGVWMSRTLTAPLEELGKATQAIGRQDLSQRVTVKGTDEVQAVATGFNEMAELLEKEETLRQNLLADVSHELRNPLHVLQGNLQAMLDDVYPLSLEEIGRLADQTRHLTALVDDLHELAQAEAHQLPLHKQETDIARLVKRSADGFKPVAEANGVTLQVELLGTIPSVNVDAARIRQVTDNLLNNALRHTPRGGLIKVIVERRNAEMTVTVRDTGGGISPEHLDRVFDRFYRTDTARSRDSGGTGLGLAIVRAIIEEHGGRVTVTSEGPDTGSNFTFYLPLDT